MNNRERFDQASHYIPGGVNSPIRAFSGIGIPPLFIKKGAGKYITDEEGREYLDFCGSWGPLILGHAHPAVVDAVRSAAGDGLTFGAATMRETELARLVCRMVPTAERVRFVNSGTEAVMTALRLARGFTGRSTIIKFDGCYHGHSDAMLVKAGSGVALLAHSSSAGVSAELVAHTVVVPFNDFEALSEAVKKAGSDLAAIIVEPVAANMGLVLPASGFLAHLRSESKKADALLIFDEVITGFRLAKGGAQERFGVFPDITVLGKIIGGGMPVGAIAGRADIMNFLAPLGPVYQAGTLSGNPLAMAAGIATLSHLNEEAGLFESLDRLGVSVAKELRNVTGLTVNQIGSLFTLFYTDRPVNNFHDAKQQNGEQFAKVFVSMINRGIYLPAAAFETAFLSICHDETDVQRLAQELKAALSE